MNPSKQQAPIPYLAFILAALAMLGPFSIDTYLPAFPAIEQSLQTTTVHVQQTLTAYMLPFSLMMLWHGALSDAFGRRRVILWGLAVYAAASIFCVFATTIEMLWLGRALQGASSGVGMVVGRAIVRDKYDGAAAQRLMANIGMIFAIAPAAAPIFGGILLAFAEWHVIFAFLGALGVGVWLLVWLQLPDTLPVEQRQPFSPDNLWRGYLSVFGNLEFMRYALALGLIFNGMFVYVMSAPVFLMQHMKLSAQSFAWMFVPMVTGMMLGSFISGKLAGKLTPRQCIMLGFALMGMASLINITVNLNGTPHLFWVMFPLPFFTCGLGVAIPGLQILALDLFPDRRGMASSCQGVIQAGTNVLVAGIIAPLMWGSTLLLSLAMAGATLLAFLIHKRQA